MDVRLAIGEQHPSGEISTALLLCDNCRVAYPVYDGVPRLFPYFLEDFRSFVAKNQALLDQHAGYSLPAGPVPKGEEATQRSFSQQWAGDDYGGVLWNYTYERLGRLFLWELNMSPPDLRHKLVLDCGCGNGKFGELMSAHGAEVVGMDLSFSVVSSHKKFMPLENVHFVQGTLFKPPFKAESFDVIYSHGVMHHTCDTRKAFLSVAALCKNGGRYSVWLYGEYKGVSSLFHAVTNSIRFFVSRLPPIMQNPMVSLLAGIYGFARRNLRGYMTKSPAVEYDRKQLLHVTRDRFTPRYAHLQSAEEVKRWYREAGFPNPVYRAHLLDEPHYTGGVAIYGDRPLR